MIVPLAANAAHTVADRNLGAGDLRGGGAAHLAYALLRCVHAGMHVGEAERPPPLVLSGNLLGASLAARPRAADSSGPSRGPDPCGRRSADAQS
jgi:hypothetical protein